MWVNGSDIYIAIRAIGHTAKISLHEQGPWRSALTKEFIRSGSPLLREPGDRSAIEWPRPSQFEPGWTAAFMIIVPSSQRGPRGQGGKPDAAVKWHPDPGPGMDTRFFVLLAAPGVTPTNEWPGKESMASRFIACLALANGETAWVIAQDVPSPAGNDDYLANMRPVMLAEAQEAGIELPPSEQLRGYLFGEADRGLRFYVDVNMAN